MRLLRRTKLPIELTNGNDGRRKNWYKPAKIRKDIESQLRLLQLAQAAPFAHPVAVKVERILGPGQKLWDYSSGLRGNWKEIEDALVACNWFSDDGPKWIKRVWFEQDASRRDEGPCVVVHVYEWDAKTRSENELD